MSIVTFQDLYEKVQDFVDDDSAGTLTRIKSAINREYKRIANNQDWEELRVYLDSGVNFVADQAYLALPGDASQVISIVNQTSNVPLKPKSFKQSREDHPATLGTSGRVDFYSVLGYKATSQPLASNSSLRVQSSSAQSPERTITIRGLKWGQSPEITESISITTDGVNTVVGGGLTFRSGWSVDSIASDTAPTAYIIITDATSNEVAHIPKGLKHSQYLIVQFEQPPDAADLLAVVYKKRIQELSADGDGLMIPDAAQAIVDGAIAYMRAYDRDYEKARWHSRERDTSLSSLLAERDSQGTRHFQMRPDLGGRPPRRGY